MNVEWYGEGSRPRPLWVVVVRWRLSRLACGARAGCGCAVMRFSRLLGLPSPPESRGECPTKWVEGGCLSIPPHSRFGLARDVRALCALESRLASTRELVVRVAHARSDPGHRGRCPSLQWSRRAQGVRNWSGIDLLVAPSARAPLDSGSRLAARERASGQWPQVHALTSRGSRRVVDQSRQLG